MADITADQLNAKSIRIDDSSQILYTPVGTVVNSATNVLQCSSLEDYDNIEPGDVILVGNQPYTNDNIATVDSKNLPDLLNVTKQTAASVPTFFRVLKPRLYLGKYDPSLFDTPESITRFVVGGTEAYFNGALGISYIRSEAEVNPYSDHIDIEISSKHDVNLNADLHVNLNSGLDMNLSAANVLTVGGAQLKLEPGEIVVDQNTRTITLENSVPGNEVDIAGDIKHVGSFTGGFGNASLSYTDIAFSASNNLTLNGSDLTLDATGNIVIGSDPNKSSLVTFWQENYQYENDVNITSLKEYNLNSTGNVSIGGPDVTLNGSNGVFLSGLQLTANASIFNITSPSTTINNTTLEIINSQVSIYGPGTSLSVNAPVGAAIISAGDVDIVGGITNVGDLANTTDLNLKSSATLVINSADIDIASSGPLKLSGTSIDFGSSPVITSGTLTLNTTAGDIEFTAVADSDIRYFTSGSGQIIFNGDILASNSILLQGNLEFGGTNQEIITTSGSFTTSTGGFNTQSGDITTLTGTISATEGSLIGGNANIGDLHVTKTSTFDGNLTINSPQINAPDTTLTVGSLNILSPINSTETIQCGELQTNKYNSFDGRPYLLLSETTSTASVLPSYPTLPWFHVSFKEGASMQLGGKVEYNLKFMDTNYFSIDSFKGFSKTGSESDLYFEADGWYDIKLDLGFREASYPVDSYYSWYIIVWRGTSQVLTQVARWTDSIYLVLATAWRHRYYARLSKTFLFHEGDRMQIVFSHWTGQSITGVPYPRYLDQGSIDIHYKRIY